LPALIIGRSAPSPEPAGFSGSRLKKMLKNARKRCRRVEPDRDQPAHRDEQLDQRDPGRPVLGGRQNVADRVAQRRRPGGELEGVVGDLETPDQKPAHEYAQDDALDEVGLPDRRTEEPGALRPQVALPPVDQIQDPGQAEDADPLGDEAVDDPVPENRQPALGVDDLEVRLHDQQEQDHERDHHEPVRRADCRPLQHPGVTERLGQHLSGASALVGEAFGRRLTLPDHRRDGQDRTHRQHDGRDRDGAGQDGGDYLRDPHLRSSSIGCLMLPTSNRPPHAAGQVAL
jgi:hypothetical protein